MPPPARAALEDEAKERPGSRPIDVSAHHPRTAERPAAGSVGLAPFAGNRAMSRLAACYPDAGPSAAPLGLLPFGGNRAMSMLVARGTGDEQSRPATSCDEVQPLAGAPAWLGHVYVHAGLVPAEDVPALLMAAGPRAIAQAQQCREPVPSEPDGAEAVRVQRRGGESRVNLLDWDAVAKTVVPADSTGRGSLVGVSLRHAFYAHRLQQLQSAFGVSSVELVLSAVAVAEAGGRPDVAAGLRAQLSRAHQYAVTETLNVSVSGRYKGPGKTFCNIYAYDFVTAMGGYLPRVWWTASAWNKIVAGAEIVTEAEFKRLRKMDEPVDEVVAPVYDVTLKEMRANDLNAWMRTVGGDFGWREETDMDVAQAAANSGKIVVLLAANDVATRSGHVTVVLAESPDHQALRDENGVVQVPLQSQAGTNNFKYSAESGAPGSRSKQWWRSKTHKDGAAWVYSGAVRSPLVTPEEAGAAPQ